MDKIVIVGSGASSVHFALSVLQKGYEVIMLDVGIKKPDIVNPEDSFNDLKTNLSDPVKYFLGENFEAVIYPDFQSEYYGFPPSKAYIFSKPSNFSLQSNGFTPLLSFAQGGLAETWTGGAYPFNERDLSDFPFCYKEIEPYYSEVTNRIGITGVKDDLVRFFPFHENLLEPVDLDQHAGTLLAQYEKRKGYLNNKLRCFLGRSRVATLSRDKEDRKACGYLGRCLWGCPTDALYTPSITLKECRKYPNFRYIPNMYVSHFKVNSKRRIGSVVAQSVHKKELYEFELDKLVLGAGTLSSSKIFLDSIFKYSGEIIKLHGLMDNRQVFIPFINLRMIGKRYEQKSYQYHLLSLGMEGETPREYIHGQITTLKTALVHPIIQNMPLDFKTSVFLFRNMRAALGMVNVNLHDTRREGNFITIEVNPKASQSRLLINYLPAVNEEARINKAIGNMKKALWSLGCIVPPGMIHIRPSGASVHYAGTLPMSTPRLSLTSSMYCQSHDFDNLYMVDGTTFPFLPSKNITFTLMANAVRVADRAF